MDGLHLTAEVSSGTTNKAPERARSVVFQPQKLKEVVDIIDLMGNVASRVREDKSGDLGGGGSGGAQQGAGTGATGTSARDEAIAKAPPIPVMQKKLIVHLEHEVKTLERKARKLSNTKTPGGAYLLNELYKKIRSLTALIARILHASSDLIRRFYISVFIDRQPLVVTGTTLLGIEAE